MINLRKQLETGSCVCQIFKEAISSRNMSNPIWLFCKDCLEAPSSLAHAQKLVRLLPRTSLAVIARMPTSPFPLKKIKWRSNEMKNGMIKGGFEWIARNGRTESVHSANEPCTAVLGLSYRDNTKSRTIMRTCWTGEGKRNCVVAVRRAGAHSAYCYLE